jgi:hypothetical protein
MFKTKQEAGDPACHLLLSGFSLNLLSDAED